MALLLRGVLGETLRGRRVGQRRTLRDVSNEARVSLGYLSEVERGQKEASSELLSAICTALGVRLSEVMREVAEVLRQAEVPRRTVPAITSAPERELVGVGGRGELPESVPFDAPADHEVPAEAAAQAEGQPVDQAARSAYQPASAPVASVAPAGRTEFAAFDPSSGQRLDEFSVDSVVFDAELARVTAAGAIVPA